MSEDRNNPTLVTDISIEQNRIEEGPSKYHILFWYHRILVDRYDFETVQIRTFSHNFVSVAFFDEKRYFKLV